MVRHEMTQSLEAKDLKENLAVEINASNLQKVILHEERIDKMKAKVHDIYSSYFPRNSSTKSFSKILPFHQPFVSSGFGPNIYFEDIIYSDDEFIYFDVPKKSPKPFRKDNTFYNYNATSTFNSSNCNMNNYLNLNKHISLNVPNSCLAKINNLTTNFNFTNKENKMTRLTPNKMKYFTLGRSSREPNNEYYKSEYGFNLDHILHNSHNNSVDKNLCKKLVNGRNISKQDVEFKPVSKSHNNKSLFNHGDRSDDIDKYNSKSFHIYDNSCDNVYDKEPQAKVIDASTQTKLSEFKRIAETRGLKGCQFSVDNLLVEILDNCSNDLIPVKDKARGANDAKTKHTFRGHTSYDSSHSTIFNSSSAFENARTKSKEFQSNVSYISEDEGTACIVLTDFSDTDY